MRKLITILLLALITLGAGARGKKDKNVGIPGIHFETTTHDFGTIREADGPVKVAFEFTNTGDAPLVIISATSSCGCTVPDYPKAPIAPGKSGKIAITYNPSHRPGEFDKTITIRTNVASRKKSTLRICGNVVPTNVDE